MSVNVHNPDQYMAALRTVIAQGRKRIGFLIGAGAPAGMAKPKYAKQIGALKKELDKQDIETILSRIRSLSKVIGKTAIHDLDGTGYEQFGKDTPFMYDRLMQADSIGTFFNLEIKNAYPCNKV